VGPDTRIDPAEQVAFYDPGLSSATDGGHFKVGWLTLDNDKDLIADRCGRFISEITGTQD
jgi:hypothetical protein